MTDASGDFLYLDDDVVVVNKSAGEVVHRGWERGGPVLMTRVRDTLGAWVYPVHRLDRATSGAVIFGRSPGAARALAKEFEARAVAKRYLALVRGVPVADEGTIDHPVYAQERGGPRQDAVTDWSLRATDGRYSILECRPRTGRLHQIRRHLKHESWPIIGDVRYGKGEHNRLFRARFGLHRLGLHATALSLMHPISGAPISVRAELPDSLRAPLLRWAEASGIELPET